MPSPLQIIFRLLIIAMSAFPLFFVLTARAEPPHRENYSNHRILTAASTSLDYGKIQLGNSQTQFETLTNSAYSTVTISQANVTGPGFGVRGLTLPLKLERGQSVTFNVLCTPLGLGSMTGTIEVVSDASNSKLDIALSGNGVSTARLTSSLTALNFGIVAVGTSKTVNTTLTAQGSSLTISSATSTSPEFRLGGLSLPKTIAAGETVSVSLTFTPQSSGTASGNITLSDSATNTLLIESLAGSGSAGSPHSVDLQWSPVPSGVAGYNVYRSSTPGGPYTKINAAPDTGSNYLDNSVLGGVTYYYVSTAIGSNGSESKYSSQLQVAVPNP
jgi:hypothetical protein